jgi:hypothetical protein
MGVMDPKQLAQLAFLALSALDPVGPLNVAKCGGHHTM